MMEEVSEMSHHNQHKKKKTRRKTTPKTKTSGVKAHMDRVKKEVRKCEKKVAGMIKKHPERAALIATTVVAAIGAGVAAAAKFRRR